jgi:crossover junction endodeoxyribonuclease RuvC
VHGHALGTVLRVALAPVRDGGLGLGHGDDCGRRDRRSSVSPRSRTTTRTPALSAQPVRAGGLGLPGGAVRADAYARAMRVVGIDPGLAACGFGVVDASGPRLGAVDYGCWHTPAGRPIELRLLDLFDMLRELVVRQRPDAVALEESFVGADARTALSIGQVRGALILACAQAGVECSEYAPARVKQAVCGHGAAEKEQVQQMAKAILRLQATPTPTHAADALAVAICHATAPPLLRLAG